MSRSGLAASCEDDARTTGRSKELVASSSALTVEPLPSWERIHQGVLPNGFQYLVLPNNTPPGRLDVHLAVRVGSIAESESEQGMAHFLEHLVFLGTEAYPNSDVLRALFASWGMSYGGDSNALTDFRQTLYTFHIPIKSVMKANGSLNHSKDVSMNGTDGDSERDEDDDEEDEDEEASEEDEEDDVEMQDADSTGAPTFADTTPQSQKEALLAVLEVISQIAFHARIREESVQSERGAVLSEAQTLHTADYYIEYEQYQLLHADNILAKRFPIGKKEHIAAFTAQQFRAFYRKWYRPDNMMLFLCGCLPEPGGVADAVDAIRHVFGSVPRPNTPLPSPPEIIHDFTFRYLDQFAIPLSGPTPTLAAAPTQPHPSDAASCSPAIRLFQHELLTNVSFSFVTKSPLERLNTTGELWRNLLFFIVEKALALRVDAAEKASAAPPASVIEFGTDDSFSENATISSLDIVAARPADWAAALRAGVFEAARLAVHGIGHVELERCLDIILQECRQDAEKVDSMENAQLLESVEDDVSIGNTLMSPRQYYECVASLRPYVAVADVNLAAREMLRFVVDFVSNTHPTRNAALFVGLPTTHLALPEKVKRPFVAPSPREIADVIMSALRDAVAGCALHDADIPEHLIRPAELDAVVAATRPQWNAAASVDDVDTGVAVRRLSNGVSVNYVRTPFEAKHFTVRFTVRGGLLCESTPEDRAALFLGLQTLVLGGAAGVDASTLTKWSSLRGLRFEYALLLETMYLNIDATAIGAAPYGGGVEAALHMLHVVLARPDWLAVAFERSRRDAMLAWEAVEKDIEALTFHRTVDFAAVAAATGTPVTYSGEIPGNAFEHVSLAAARAAIERRLQRNAANAELSIVGDYGIDNNELERLVLRYIGSLSFAEADGSCTTIPLPPPSLPIAFCHVNRLVHVRLHDAKERACMYVALPGMSRWGCRGNRVFGQSGMHHPLYAARVLMLLTEIINNRLYFQLRERLGLFYSAHAEAVSLNFSDGGLVYISMTPFPDKLAVTFDALLGVLRGLQQSDANSISEAEFMEARAPLVENVKTSLHRNDFWRTALGGLLLRAPPGGWKDAHMAFDTVLHRIPEAYSRMTAEEVARFAAEFIDIDHLWVGIGTVGPHEAAFADEIALVRKKMEALANGRRVVEFYEHEIHANKAEHPSK